MNYIYKENEGVRIIYNQCTENKKKKKFETRFNFLSVGYKKAM